MPDSHPPVSQKESTADNKSIGVSHLLNEHPTMGPISSLTAPETRDQDLPQKETIDSIPTPEYTVKELFIDPPSDKDTSQLQIKTEGETLSLHDQDQPLKRRDSETPQLDDSATPKPKKSRKLQGVGVKKPLYSRYETIYIIKAYKTLSERHPTLVLIDLFKIVAILFNDEAIRQGFKDRTPDQLYQKYKRIQHGLNHGETEFMNYFRKNAYNPKEWIPDFTEVQEYDQVLKFIQFPKLDDAIAEVLGHTVANLKPPFSNDVNQEQDDGEEAQGANANASDDQHEADEELLNLAGYDAPTSTSITELQKIVVLLQQRLHHKEHEIALLQEGHVHKDTEISFLKNMLKEDLSYIRMKLQENEQRRAQ